MTPNRPTPRPVFTRIALNPLMIPRRSLDWEAGGAFAPAVVKNDTGYHMYYRAFGADKISRIGYAKSQNGLIWEIGQEPLLSPKDNAEKWGMEDPRAVIIDGMTMITYTAASGHTEPDGWHWTTRVRIATSRDGQNFIRHNLVLPEIDNKDAVLFPRKIRGKYYLIHRFMPDIWISSSPDLTVWHDHRRLLEPVAGSWQQSRIGAGSPPIETPLGWLVFYHGVSVDLTYSMSAFILDLNDPTIVTHRLPYPLIVPGEPYETKGYVPNVVFGTGVTEEEDTYRLYYGGADFVIAAAEIDKAALLEALADYPSQTAPARPIPKESPIQPADPNHPIITTDDNPWGDREYIAPSVPS